MFDMFDNSNRGWLIRLIEEVEEDMVEEEEVVVGAAIVESEFVETCGICYTEEQLCHASNTLYLSSRRIYAIKEINDAYKDWFTFHIKQSHIALSLTGLIIILFNSFM